MVLQFSFLVDICGVWSNPLTNDQVRRCLFLKNGEKSSCSSHSEDNGAEFY